MLPFHPQILTRITGKGSAVRINVDREDGFHRWKWQSELNGERLPSVGMELVPFSEKKARDLSEGSEQTAWVQRMGEHLSPVFLSQEPHWEIPPAASYVSLRVPSQLLSVL